MIIGVLGLAALGLAIWGSVLVRRGQGGRGLLIAAVVLGSVLIVIDLVGWGLLISYLVRKARTRARSAHVACSCAND